MNAVSVVIIARNEEQNLRRSLPALRWCDDVVVVTDDTNSDSTAAVAGQLGARVIIHPFESFGKQKRFAVSQARHHWVLSLDADEMMDETLAGQLVSFDPGRAGHKGYYITRRHVFLGCEFRYGKESADRLLRLFDKRCGNFDEAPVHEKVILEGSAGLLPGLLLHHSYDSLDQFIAKLNVYTDRGAQKLFDKGRKRSMLLSVLSFPFYFIKHYIVYRNFLNGRYGFLWSLLSAWYHVIKYLKLHELHRASPAAPSSSPTPL